MPHSIKRGLFRLTIGLMLIAGTLAMWSVLFDFTRPAPTSASFRLASDATRYCSNFDFLNSTGQDVNGLQVRLQGIKNIGSAYNGPDNPFGLPDASSGYEAATNVYRLNFSGGTAFDADMVHIGLCSDAPVLLLDQQSGLPSFSWTNNGNPVLPNPLFTGLQWEWITPSHLRIHIVNGQTITATLNMLNLLDSDTALSLDDLKPDTIGSMPTVLILVDTPQVLAPQSDSFFDITFALNRPTRQPNAAPLLAANHPYIIQAELGFEDDPWNTAHLFAQGLSPQNTLYLPLIER
jgi:hypothetical protein